MNLFLPWRVAGETSGYARIFDSRGAEVVGLGAKISTATCEAVTMAVNERAALVAVFDAAEAHQDAKPGEEMARWMELQRALDAAKRTRGGKAVS